MPNLPEKREKHPKINKFYTLGEEIANSVSHGVGAMLAVAGTAILILFAVLTRDAWRVVSSSIFGASLIILYTSSTLYHSFQHPKVKALFRIFDHCNIYLLIAGTYTPYTLVSLREYSPVLGWTLFGVVWGAAVFGIVLNAVNLERYKVVSMICYVAMGWVVIFAMRPLMQSLASTGVLLLFLGGIAYTVGIVFYALNGKIRYMHSVWHLFTLAGSALHYLSILIYVIQ